MRGRAATHRRLRGSSRAALGVEPAGDARHERTDRVGGVALGRREHGFGVVAGLHDLGSFDEPLSELTDVRGVVDRVVLEVEPDLARGCRHGPVRAGVLDARDVESSGVGPPERVLYNPLPYILDGHPPPVSYTHLTLPTN